MKVHPFAEVWPLLVGPELQKLTDDIKEHGLRFPIVTLNGFILDGRNRLAACKAAHVKPRFVEYDGPTDDASVAAYLDSVNDKRRHLGVGPRSVAAFKLSKMISQDGSGGHVAPTQDQAAQQFSVSENSLKRAGKVVTKGTKELVAAVERGEVPVADAASITDLPKAKQSAVLRKAKSEGTTLKQARIRGGTSFDVIEIEAAPTKATKPKKSGKPVVSRKDRTEAQKHLGGLIRALKAIDLYDEFVQSLSQIAARLKQV